MTTGDDSNRVYALIIAAILAGVGLMVYKIAQSSTSPDHWGIRELASEEWALVGGLLAVSVTLFALQLFGRRRR